MPCTHLTHALSARTFFPTVRDIRAHPLRQQQEGGLGGRWSSGTCVRLVRLWTGVSKVRNAVSKVTGVIKGTGVIKAGDWCY